MANSNAIEVKRSNLQEEEPVQEGSESEETRQQRELDEAFAEFEELEELGVKTQDQLVQLRVDLEGSTDEKIAELESKLAELGVPPLTQETKNKILGNDVEGVVGLETRKAEKHAALLEVLSAAGKIEGKDVLADSLSDDPRFKKIVEEASLEYLKTKDSKWFRNSIFSGEVGPSGYLLDKKGKGTNFLPSQNITAGLDEVMKNAREIFAYKFPKEFTQYRNAEEERMWAKIDKAELARKQKIGAENARVLSKVTGKQVRLRADGKFSVIGRNDNIMPGDILVTPNDSSSRESLLETKIQGALEEVPDTEKLKDENYLSGDTIGIDEFSEGEDLGVLIVDNNAIVGHADDEDSGSWEPLTESRGALVEKMAQDIRTNSTAQADAAGFELNAEKQSAPQDAQVNLRRVDGPEGPIFFVKDGADRVAASKLAKMSEMLAKVERAKEPDQITTKDSKRANEWKKMMERGLIEGQVKGPENEEFSLEIKNQVLPWCSAERKDFFVANTAYDRVYPEAFDKIKSLKKPNKEIPREVFLDKTGGALDRYLYEPDKLYEYIKSLKDNK